MKNVIIILVALFCSCTTSKNTASSNNKILGRWCSKSYPTNYLYLTFRQNGYVTFDCKIDTVFGLKYTLNKNQLSMVSTDKSTFKSKILKLTQDSLVLETLLALQTQQVYYRCGM